MRKLLILASLVLTLSGCQFSNELDIAETKIQTCQNMDGTGFYQTYPCKWDEYSNGIIPQQFGHQDEIVTIYYRGTDAGCPDYKGAKCIDVDDWNIDE